MVFRWFTRRRWANIVAEPFPEQWRPHLESHFAYWSVLSPEEQRTLEGIVQVLIADKHWEGCGGLQLTEAMQVIISVQAGLLILGHPPEGHHYYDNVDSILVYPSTYVVPGGRGGADGTISHDDRIVLGTAHMGGPVVLSWNSALKGGIDHRDGRNVVYHEFAHKLDMLDGAVDGAPTLEHPRDYADWAEVMSDAYTRLRAKVAKGRRTLIDAYGATEPAEFFAVATEHFFEQPRQVLKEEPELYRVLSSFYKQDPAKRLTAR
ncbi:MAG: zinc-dependent peptidase [Bradymonadia bacterium]